MRLIKPYYSIEAINGGDLLLLEKAGRTCYKSEPKGSPEKFIKDKISLKHLTIIEHGSMTVRFIADRGFTHELVRHRMAVYSQESTRYCNYSSGVTFIIPVWTSIKEGNIEEIGNLKTPEQIFNVFAPITKAEKIWLTEMVCAEGSYLRLLKEGWTPQKARVVLPTSLKTEIVMTANFREWRLIFEQRALGRTGNPHPQMLELMVPLLKEVKTKIPVIFDDLIVDDKEVNNGTDKTDCAN